MLSNSSLADYVGVSARERRWVLAYAGIIMLFTSLPYLAGFARQGEDWRFTGFVFGVEDGNSYIAKMLSGSQGAWLFRTPYTPYPQNGIIAFLPYLLLGKLAAPPAQHEQLVALFHLFRIAAGLLAIIATYDFLSLFVREVAWRRLALVVATIGGGLGWLAVLLGWEAAFGSLPLEFYSPESFGFLALYGLPHLALARAFLLWGLRSYLLEGGTGDRAKGAVAGHPQPRIMARLRPYFSKMRSGIFFLLIGLAQPLTVVVAWILVGAHVAGLGIWQGWRARRGRGMDLPGLRGYARQAALSLAVSLPVVVYTGYFFSRDPYLREWAAQNLILSPHPFHYLIAYGVMVPFSLFGALHLLRNDAWRAWLLLAWVILLPVLAYAPYHLQRRLPEGVWVAIVALSIVALQHWQGRMPRWKTAGLLACVFTIPAALILLAGGLLATISPGKPVFRPAGEVSAYQALSRQARAGEVVLSAYETGNALPAWAPVRVVIGHGPESAGLAELQPQVAEFFQPETRDSARLAFLQTHAISYLFWGPAEKALGEWDPAEAQYLQPIYQGAEITVFAIQDPARPASEPAGP